MFGTNPLGIEYDGQVSGEGQTSGIVDNQQSGTGGLAARRRSDRLNPNWDGDWRVKSAVTERGWETEIAIPFKTLRYRCRRGQDVGPESQAEHPPQERTGVPGAGAARLRRVPRVVGRQARRASILPPRARLQGDAVRARVGEQGLRRCDQAGDATSESVRGSQHRRRREVGIRPNLTADFTVNTDFAQVEADEEQVNLTRFDLFFPRSARSSSRTRRSSSSARPQKIDLFFSRRIGLSATGSTGVPIDIDGGARVSGKVGSYNVGLLDMQTQEAHDGQSGRLVTPANNFGVLRVQREVGRSNFGGIYVNREGTGRVRRPRQLQPRVRRGREPAGSKNAKVFAFIARTRLAERAQRHAPARRSTGPQGAGYSGRVFYNYTDNIWQLSGGYSRVDNNSNPEAGYLLGAATSGRSSACSSSRSRSAGPGSGASRRIRATTPSTVWTMAWCRARWATSISSRSSRGRVDWFGTFVDRNQDRPISAFRVFNAGGKTVVIPPGLYTWYQLANEYISDPSAKFAGMVRWRHGGFYNGDFEDRDLAVDARRQTLHRLGRTTRGRTSTCHTDTFHTDLVPVKVSYAFTTLASVQALVQYNNQSALLTSNIRLALLNRSGTGLFSRPQRSPRHDGVHADRDARAIVHREIHAAVRLLIRG